MSGSGSVHSGPHDAVISAAPHMALAEAVAAALPPHARFKTVRRHSVEVLDAGNLLLEDSSPISTLRACCPAFSVSVPIYFFAEGI